MCMELSALEGRPGRAQGGTTNDAEPVAEGLSGRVGRRCGEARQGRSVEKRTRERRHGGRERFAPCSGPPPAPPIDGSAVGGSRSPRSTERSPLPRSTLRPGGAAFFAPLPPCCSQSCPPRGQVLGPPAPPSVDSPDPRIGAMSRHCGSVTRGGFRGCEPMRNRCKVHSSYQLVGEARSEGAREGMPGTRSAHRSVLRD